MSRRRRAATLGPSTRCRNRDVRTLEERVAIFDNDGTLWVEKPMPIQLDFTLRRLGEQAAADASLRDRQPWKACYEKRHAWLGQRWSSTTTATTATCAC